MREYRSVEPLEKTDKIRKIPELFYAGNHPELLRQTVDRPDPQINVKRIHFIIGSLAFMGRLDEAEVLLARYRTEMNEEVLCAARFFLGTGLCRLSFYAKSRKLFFENLALGRKSDNPSIRFFTYQGLGFYRFFCGRFANAERAAKKAHAAVLTTSFLWGKIVALDLMGHSCVETGEISLGVSKLEQASDLSRNLGDGGIAQAIQISLACIRAQFGLVPIDRAIKDLEKLNREVADNDTYSHASILLELGRAYRLAGRIHDARMALNRSCHFIYSARNRRQAITLNHRYAMLAFSQGEFEQALLFLGSTRNDLVTGVDSAYEVEILGLEIRIRERLGITDRMPSMIERIRYLTFYTGNAVSIRIWNRRTQDSTSLRSVGEDPLGDLVDLAKPGSVESVDAIVKSGCLSLMGKVFSIDEKNPAMLLGVAPGSLLACSGGDISWIPKGLTATLEKMIRHLASVRRANKEQLIEKVWGYAYRPLSHDTLVYSTISRLKGLLGSRADWIEVSDSGYSLNAKVRLQVLTQAESREGTNERDIGPLPEEKLNHRQILLLRELKKREFLAVRESMKIFRVSEITANRDLTDLFKMGLIARVGKGRATRYRSRESDGGV
jgi:tetratricopeptide (TPR) repeat protein